MNILLVNHYVGSPVYGMEYRPFYLAKEWVKQGHNVTIVGASFSHLRQQNPIVTEDLQIEMVDGIKYRWIKTPIYNSSIKRIINIVVFVHKLLKYAKKLAKEECPDLVIASSTYPVDIYPSRKIARICLAKLIYEVHDLWPLSPMLIGGYSKWHPFIMVMQKGEDDAYKYSDKVISLLWNAEDHMKRRGLAEGKFKCIPNGYLPEEWTDEARNLPLLKEHKAAFIQLKDKIVVGFAGGFAASGALDTLIDAAALLKNNNGIHFVLVGEGPEKKRLRSRLEKEQLHNITILPAVPKKLIPAVYREFDIVYMGGIHSPLHKYGTSYNKMTDSMLSCKPIIQAIDEPNCVAERLGCGIQVEAENASKVVESIVELANMSAEERFNMGLKGRIYAENNLPWSKLAKDFIDVFK